MCNSYNNGHCDYYGVDVREMNYKCGKGNCQEVYKMVCPKCKGEKVASYRHTEYNGDWENKKSKCETCSGTGKVDDNYCNPNCDRHNKFICQLSTQLEDGVCRFKKSIL